MHTYDLISSPLLNVPKNGKGLDSSNFKQDFEVAQETLLCQIDGGLRTVGWWHINLRGVLK